MIKQCVNCPGRTDHFTLECAAFSPHSPEAIQVCREAFEQKEKAAGRSVERDDDGDYIDPIAFFGWFEAVAVLPSSPKPCPELLARAEVCGARITGKPNGSEPIEVVFPIEAWRAFDAATRASLPVGVPDGYALVPVEPSVELLTAMSLSLGMHPLGDGADGSYPITGAQSTVMQCYRAILAAAPTVKAEPATAQDERDPFKPYRLAGEFCVSRGIDDDSEIRPKILDAFCSGYACADRPVQTEPVPAQDERENWSVALLQVAVVLEALRSSDSATRLANMDAGKVLGEAYAKLQRIRASRHAQAEQQATVKAEQVQCDECGDHEDDCSKAPYLPAAVSAVEEVEVVAHIAIDDPTPEEHGDWDIEPDTAKLNELARRGGGRIPLMIVAQHNRIVDAISAKPSSLAHGIGIPSVAEFGEWVDLNSPDPATRGMLLALFKWTLDRVCVLNANRAALSAQTEQQPFTVPAAGSAEEEVERCNFEQAYLRFNYPRVHSGELSAPPIFGRAGNLRHPTQKEGDYEDVDMQKCWVMWRARAALSAQQSAHVSVPECKLGIRGRAYDAPSVCRAYTYTEQPNNDHAWKLGKAASAVKAGGDYIDAGLSLLEQLQANGFGVFELRALLNGGEA
jgi:hypothetical protein